MKNTPFNLIRGFYNREIEENFRQDYFEKLKYQIRIGFVISIFIYLVFYFIDNWVFPELEPKLMVNRIIITGTFILILLFSFTKMFAKYLQSILLFFGIVATLGIIWKLWYLNASGYDFSFFYTGLILTTSIVTFYLRIRFIYAVWLNLVCIVSYVALYLFFLEDAIIHSSISLTQTFVNSMLFLTCSSFLSLYGAYYLEVITRKDFIVTKKLEHLNNNLEQLVRQRTSELESEKLKNIRMLLEGQEKERERIATDLHDNICNRLALLRHDLEMQAGSTDFSKINNSINTIKEVNKEVRYLSQNQSAHILKKYGLVTAIEELVNTIANEYNIKIALDFFGEENNLSEDIQINLYRSCQEALHNIVKHASATEVELQLIHHDHSIDLTISDNGNGFDYTNYKGMGLGLESIKLRIEKQLGGRVNIDSREGQGTTIIITVNTREP